uniref:CHK kinase-like domain-containing protein n=1 Tax=Stomoxys calcitrans TaxID=35570 RepID=A0A1I8PLT4_STOCA
MSTKNGVINPNETLCIPSWICVEYFHDVVFKDNPDMATIIGFTSTAATPPGENYTSIMLRLHFTLEMKDGSLKEKTYILKTMLENEKAFQTIYKLALFPKEMKMYSEYLPAFEKLYRAIGWNIKLAPRCLLSEKKGDLINLVFEDLQEKNFKNINRLKGCNMSHMRQILRKLAELHAASAVYEQQYGAYPEEFQYSFINQLQDEAYLKRKFDVRTNSYKKAMSQWDCNKAEEYIKKFPTFEQYRKCAMASMQPSPYSFNVLNHGDFWSSNIMFSYDANGDLHETLLLDFQVCKWGSPSEDLLFLLTISPESEIRFKEYDHFITIYHQRLLECLKALDYRKSLPTLRSLHQAMYDKRNTFYAFYACLNRLAVTFLPPDSNSSIQNFDRPDEVGEKLRMKAYTNPIFVDVIKNVFRFYHQRGLFSFEDF